VVLWYTIARTAFACGYGSRGIRPAICKKEGYYLH
jgi:hypothetical protein